MASKITNSGDLQTNNVAINQGNRASNSNVANVVDVKNSKISVQPTAKKTIKKIAEDDAVTENKVLFGNDVVASNDVESTGVAQAGMSSHVSEAVEVSAAATTTASPLLDGQLPALLAFGGLALGTSLLGNGTSVSAAPVSPTVALTTDSGSNAADRITNNAALTVSAAAAGVTRSYMVDGGAAAATYTAPAVDGVHTVVVTDTDVAGNVASTSLSFTFDSTAPLVSSALTATIGDTGGGITSATTLYSAIASDNDAASNVGISYSIAGSGVDNALFDISNSGVVTFKSTTTFGSPKDIGANNVYDITVRASDVAGNVTDKAVAITVSAPSSIAVYTDAAHTISAGNLIAPATVDGGKTYYYWDRSGDGTSAGIDNTTHDVLDGIFKYASDFTTVNTGGTNADTSDTFRYATLYTATGESVHVALPTLGATYSAGSATGTAINSGVNNATYDDLLAIWDANNGVGTTNAAVSGVPGGWNHDYYWSATSTSAGSHANLGLYNGVVTTDADPNNYYVALQVL